MGFIILVFVAIAGTIALGCSIVLAAIGIGFYIRNKTHRPQAKKLFYTPAIATVLISYIAVSMWPFPKGSPGSNYPEILLEWGTKAVIYLVAPGLGCFLGGIFILCLNRKHKPPEYVIESE